MRASLPGNLTRGVLTLALTTFAGTAAIRPVQAATQLPTGFSEQTVVSGIDRPTSLTVLPDGRVLVTEQHTGRIKLVVGNTLVATPLVIVSQQANSAEERGLLAIAVDPRWPASPYVYVHHTRTTDQQRLLRYTATGDLTTGTSTNLTLGSEYTVMDGITDASTTHNGGTLRFGSDSLLYWSLGDDNVSCLAQDSTSLHGCVMRLEVRNLQAGAGGPPARTLLVPSSNPFAQSANVNVRLVYNYGLRNPFRFQLDPASRLVYVADVGENTWEELDELGPGANAGPRPRRARRGD